MIYNLKNARVKALRDKVGRVADSFLILLSVLTAVVASGSTVVPHEHIILPWFDTSWTTIQDLLRNFTWSCFAIVFIVLGGTSHRRLLDYCRKWWLELAICILWCPFLSDLLQLTHSAVALTSLTMLGVVAHVTRVSRFIIQRLGHPLIVVVAATATVTTAGTVLMMVLEPQTYPSFGPAYFSMYVSSLTLGGPLNPQTGLGQLGYALTVTAGISVLAVYYGIIREFVHRILFKESEINEKILKQLTAQAKEIAEIKALLLASGVQVPDMPKDGEDTSVTLPKPYMKLP